MQIVLEIPASIASAIRLPGEDQPRQIKEVLQTEDQNS